MERRRAPLDVEPAGQDPAHRHAAVDAGRHRRVDRVEPAVDLLVRQRRALVGAGDVGDGEALALGDGEQLVAGAVTGAGTSQAPSGGALRATAASSTTAPPPTE